MYLAYSPDLGSSGYNPLRSLGNIFSDIHLGSSVEGSKNHLSINSSNRSYRTVVVTSTNRSGQIMVVLELKSLIKMAHT